MKIFLLLCLSTGLVSTEKLDRTYLPPPGSKFSGGSPGDIQVPLEFPKEHYLTGPPLPEGIPEIELGINSRPKPVDTAESSTQKQERLTYFQNSYPVPKTTTTFAFTQTTTFAPTEDYEGLDQSSGFLNATDPSKHSHGAGQTYQQQSNRGYSGNDPSFTQYQQGNQPSTSVPFGSTTHRPLFKSNRKPVPYLPPAPEQVPSNQDNFGYLSGQPQGPALQDGQQYSSTFGPVISQPDSIPAQANQQKQFISNVNIPSSTAAPQNQGTNRIYAKQQKFTSSVPTQKNLDVSPGNQNILTSTIGPAYKDKTRVSTGPFEENQYVQHQDFPSSTTIQGEQRTPAWNHQNQYISSSVPPKYQDDQNESPGSGQHGYKQDQNNNPGNQNFPVSTAAPHFNGQQFTTPEILQEGNQRNPSTAFPQYQDNQRFKKPGRIQETIASNQQNFGSGIPNHQNQYSRNPNFPSTATPQLQNGQQFITPGSLQPNQYFRKQNFPSTAFPQYQDTQRIFRPSEQNQYYRPPTAASQSTDSNSIQSTTPGSIHKRPLVPQENQYQSERQQIHPSSTASLHQFPTPGSIQNQFVGDKNTVLPVTGSPLFQNGQRLSTPGVREQLSTQHGSITSNENEQYPSTLAPEYQTTFASTPGSIQGVTGINQYPTQPDYNQRFPSSTVASQQFVTGSQSQYGNNGIQSIPNTSPSSQSEIGSQVYDATSLAPYYLNQGSSSTTAGPLPTSGYPSPVSGPTQNRPERPQAASDRTADILSYENVLTPEGYSYSYDTSNGIHADETGIVGNGTRAQGAYSYIGDDGKVYSVFYSADENGFQPRGDHLPTPPPIPEAIQRVIEQANKDKESGIYDDGSYDEAKYGYMKYDFNQFRPKNKTAYPTNGADIPYRPENQFGSQKNKQFISKVETEVYQGEDSVEGMDYEPKQVDGEKLYNGKINLEGESNRRISNERPIKINNLTDEGKRKNDFNRRPDSVKDYEGTGITDISDDNVDFKDLDDVSKVLDYKDDPNSRTDFNGKNKYLPNPKHAHRFMQPDNRHLSTRLPENNKQVSKQRKPNNRKKVVYEDEQASNVNKEYVFDDDTKSMTSDRPNKPGNYQSENKRISKPNKSENVMDGVKNIHAMTGYEYTTPQRKFDFEGDIKFTSRISMTERPKQTTQIGSQTTLRPFMTPNVYKNDDESLDEVMVEFDPHKKQLRPFTQKDTHPVSGKESTEYNVTPEIAYDGQFDSTKSTTSRLPFGNPQTTSIPKYEEQDTIGQKEYNTPIRTQSSRRPDNNEDYSNIARNEGLSKEVSDAFVSTTPVPHLRSNSNKGNKHPAQHHTVRKPTDAPTFYEQYTPGKDANERRPITIEGSRFPGSQAQILSTTYRPKYTFGDRTLAPSGSIKLDGYGRPFSSTIAPEDFVDISKNKPGNMEDTFSPGVGRFGVTSASTQGPGDYQGSTIAPVGEDFGGPKRPQGFDPETGYYYK